MRRHGDEKAVFQSLAMVTQFGLNMLVPICLMSALGIWLDGKFGTSWITVVCFAAGAIAGGQSIYRLAGRMVGGGQDGGRGTPGEEDGNAEKDE